MASLFGNFHECFGLPRDLQELILETFCGIAIADTNADVQAHYRLSATMLTTTITTHLRTNQRGQATGN